MIAAKTVQGSRDKGGTGLLGSRQDPPVLIPFINIALPGRELLRIEKVAGTFVTFIGLHVFLAASYP